MKLLFASLLLVTLLAAGCAPAAVTLNGTVTVNGQPVEKGLIDFAPLDKAPLSPPVPIVNGQYRIKLAPGKKQVSISAPVVTDRRPEHNGPGALIVEITAESLPARYNSKTELTLEVTAATKSQDWELKTP